MCAAARAVWGGLVAAVRVRVVDSVGVVVGVVVVLSIGAGAAAAAVAAVVVGSSGGPLVLVGAGAVRGSAACWLGVTAAVVVFEVAFVRWRGVMPRGSGASRCAWGRAQAGRVCTPPVGS